jgi:hypothetical protein
MLWNQISRIEYCGSPYRLTDRIVLHSENDRIIYVSIYQNNYLEAFQIIVSECRKKNPGVLIDQDLLKRLDSFK